MIGLGENDFDIPKVEDIDKVIRVLNILKTGQSVKLDEWEYKLTPTKHGSYSTVFKTEILSGDNLEAIDRWFGQDMSLSAFIKTCLDADEDAITIGIANSVLNKIRKKQ